MPSLSTLAVVAGFMAVAVVPALGDGVMQSTHEQEELRRAASAVTGECGDATPIGPVCVIGAGPAGVADGQCCYVCCTPT